MDTGVGPAPIVDIGASEQALSVGIPALPNVALAGLALGVIVVATRRLRR